MCHIPQYELESCPRWNADTPERSCNTQVFHDYILLDIDIIGSWPTLPWAGGWTGRPPKKVPMWVAHYTMFCHTTEFSLDLWHLFSLFKKIYKTTISNFVFSYSQEQEKSSHNLYDFAGSELLNHRNQIILSNYFESNLLISKFWYIQCPTHNITG